MDFTAIYEPQPNGTVVAYVAELPAITVGARSLEEARVRLAEQARAFLVRERTDALAGIAPQARVESLHVETGAPCDTRAEMDTGQETRVEIKAQPRSACVDHDPGDLLEFMLREGLIASLPPPSQSGDDFEPVRIDGRPISEEIIEARR